jgi:hypothetical protein
MENEFDAEYIKIIDDVIADMQQTRQLGIVNIYKERSEIEMDLYSIISSQ